MPRFQRKTLAITAAALLGSTFATAAIAAIAHEFPATYVYYDQAGNIVGERNVGCNPNQQWGEVTRRYTLRAGCGFSM